MADLYETIKVNNVSPYFDKHSATSYEEWAEMLKSSSTIYIGNLSYYTNEDQIYQVR